MRFVPFVVAAAFLLFAPALARAASTVVITRVAAYEASDHEWIEIKNTGDAPFDLTGWKFWEDNVNHGLTAFRGGMTLAPGESAVIADVAATYTTDHPEWSGMILDSSWTSLALDGEPIGLRDSAGELHQFTDVVWLSEPPGTAAPAPTADAPPTSSAPAPQGGELLLSEVLPAPTDGGEWIEVQNVASSTIRLDGQELHDAVGRIAVLTGDLAPGAYLQISLTSAKLNNSGDTVTLRSVSAVLDEVRYGDDLLPAPESGIALARDGAAWTLTMSATPGAANRITALPSAPKKSAPARVGPDTTLHPGSILINEIAPREEDGDDWIEFANRTDRRLDLRGWKLLVGADAEIPLFGKISAGSRMLVRLGGDPLPDKALLLLAAADGSTQDQVTYGPYSDGNDADNAPAPELGKTVARHEGQNTESDAEDFYLPRAATPGKQNIAPEDEGEETMVTTRAIIIPSCILPEENVAETTTVRAATTATPKKTVAKTKTVAKKKGSAPAPRSALLAEIGELPDKSKVRVTATVVGAPPASSGRIWFLGDGDAGAKLQLTGKPLMLAAGERIRLTATTDWTTGPLLRAASAAVERIGSATATVPVTRGLAELTSDDGHRLVAVRGEAVSRRGDAVTIEDGTGRLNMTLPQGVPGQTGDTFDATGIYLVGDPGRLLVLTTSSAAVSRPAAAIPGRTASGASGPSSRDSPWPLVGAAALLGAGTLLLVRRPSTGAKETSLMLDHS
ncbi:lamin tail domain-containing protein [Patescibacteria group bacterium]|nr:MAG: lamin tail domain-containing protein [Patescibacteria group bacterium]